MNNVTQIQLAAAVRQLSMAAGGWAIGKGYLTTDTVSALTTIAMIAVPLVWGQIKTRRLAQK